MLERKMNIRNKNNTSREKWRRDNKIGERKRRKKEIIKKKRKLKKKEEKITGEVTSDKK